MQLNVYFTSIATTLLANHHNLVSETAPEPVSPYIRTFNFSLHNEHEVFKALKELDQSKATECDGISVKALKLAAPNISQSLSHLFNESLRTGQFPSVWKIARVTPPPPHSPTQHSQHLQHSPTPPTPHSPTDCDNYRHISVLPCILKIMESLVNTDLRKFTHEVGLIEQHQFAYSKFSSTTVALLKVVDSWKFAIDDGLESVSVFLDLRKAFDVIKHDILLAKLESYGIKGIKGIMESYGIQWVNSYLFGRSQFVVCRDSSSELRHLPFGVPQGSVLGTTLFNINIKNISKTCHNSDFALFAYDTEIHFSSKDVGKAEYRINEDLRSINQWFSNNGLIRSTKKMVTMVIASHRAVKTARGVRISYGDSLLEQKSSFKYLGVIVDELLSWNSCISYVASRVYPKFKLLNRILSCLDPTTLLKIYKATIFLCG